MSSIQSKNLRTPDEHVVFPYGYSDEVHLGELVVARTRQEPGWRWSEHVKPIVGTASCQFHHTGVVVTGRIHWRLDDGSEGEFGPDDVFDVPPGHDAWVMGDEAVETIDWAGAHRWATPPAGERILATLLFTDIVDSTTTAQRLGDTDWNRLLEEHNAVLRNVLDRQRGREVTTTGDGMLSIFDGAERAVRAGGDIVRAVRRLHLEVRVGIHTGEIEVVPGNVRGVAVHVAARILGIAAAGEVLVSGTTRELVAERGLDFADRGLHELKGVSGLRALYALADDGIDRPAADAPQEDQSSRRRRSR